MQDFFLRAVRVKSNVNHHALLTPFPKYDFLLLPKHPEMSELLLRVSSGKQILTPSLVSWTSHYRVILGKLVNNAHLYAFILEPEISQKNHHVLAAGASLTKEV